MSNKTIAMKRSNGERSRKGDEEIKEDGRQGGVGVRVKRRKRRRMNNIGAKEKRWTKTSRKRRRKTSEEGKEEVRVGRSCKYELVGNGGRGVRGPG